MKTFWNGRHFEMRADEGEFLDSVQSHQAWIAEQKKPANRFRHLSKYASGSERRLLEQRAREIELDCAHSELALESLRNRDTTRGEIRISTTVASEAIRQERLRFVTSLENTLSGIASPFYDPHDPGTEFQLAPKLRERISRGAFAETLRNNHSIAALWSHDTGAPLGTTKSKTLRLYEDSRGLRFELQADPDTTHGANVLSMVRRGDVRGMSIGFRVTAQAYSREFGQDVRTIKSVQLSEISVVLFPAYESTSISLAP